jgi:tetratricopeptide (TPR) repeat protein/predicted Ser/Thr protein kinase
MSEQPKGSGRDTITDDPGPTVVSPPTEAVDTHVSGDRMAAPEPPRLPTGIHQSGALGRFTIVDILGTGGMGMVLAAYDPQLDRKVALKILRPSGKAHRREKEAARLLREARAMAQLSHPHVVTVYEAGTIDDQVYIAMEYIDGKTLRTWLGEERRSVPEILAAYTKAGRGLAAGHTAGVVHRDFKPDNVLIGNDGRVHVIDFGLARPGVGGKDLDSIDEDSTPFPYPTPELHQRLTTAGSFFGTPVYMSPEQHRRAELDARADQFSFCVSLYEALYRKMPFESDSYESLAAKVMSGDVRFPDDPDVPAHVVAVLRRGLRPNLDDRFPSMDALLDGLVASGAPTRSNRRAMIGWAGLGVAGVAAASFVIVRAVKGADAPAAASESPCAGGARRAAEVWNDGVREKMRATFAATKRSHADATFGNVARELDRYVAEWTGHDRQICETILVRAKGGGGGFDVQKRCVGERLDELRTLVTLFAGEPDPQIVDRSLAAVQHLPRSEACLAISPASSAVLLPEAPEARRELDEVRRGTAQVRIYQEAGKFAQAIELAMPLIERARKLGYMPVEAEIQYALGSSLSGAGKAEEADKALVETVRLAAAAKDDRLLARAYMQRVWVVGFQLAKYADAIALQPVAEAAITRAEGGDEMTGDLSYYLASAHLLKGEYALATEAYKRALALRTATLGPEHPDVAQVHNSYGGTLLRTGDLEGATAQFQRALEIREKVLGPKHPDVALPLANLASVMQVTKKLDEATTYYERALEILVEVHGPEHPNVGVTVSNLGHLSRERGDCATAVTQYTRAIATIEKLGENHPYVAYALIGRAHCHVDLGQPAVGIPDAERATTILASTADAAALAQSRFALARALWGAKRDRTRARSLAKQARDALVASGPAGAAALDELDAWEKSR